MLNFYEALTFVESVHLFNNCNSYNNFNGCIDIHNFSKE